MFEGAALSPGRFLDVLVYLTILLFVSAGLPGLAKRRRLRRAAIMAYAAALVLALALVLLWWAGIYPRSYR